MQIDIYVILRTLLKAQTESAVAAIEMLNWIRRQEKMDLKERQRLIDHIAELGKTLPLLEEAREMLGESEQNVHKKEEESAVKQQ